jgi:hypothetical protein
MPQLSCSSAACSVSRELPHIPHSCLLSFPAVQFTSLLLMILNSIRPLSSNSLYNSMILFVKVLPSFTTLSVFSRGLLVFKVLLKCINLYTVSWAMCLASLPWQFLSHYWGNTNIIVHIALLLRNRENKNPKQNPTTCKSSGLNLRRK